MAEVAERVQLLDIYVMGKRFQVPEGLTIQAALEYCGYNLIRGVGCRSGLCACLSESHRAGHVPDPDTLLPHC
jgi:hypothetical protein